VSGDQGGAMYAGLDFKSKSDRLSDYPKLGGTLGSHVAGREANRLTSELQHFDRAHRRLWVRCRKLRFHGALCFILGHVASQCHADSLDPLKLRLLHFTVSVAHQIY